MKCLIYFSSDIRKADGERATSSLHGSDQRRNESQEIGFTANLQVYSHLSRRSCCSRTLQTNRDAEQANLHWISVLDLSRFVIVLFYININLHSVRIHTYNHKTNRFVA